jgi:hypothetical protein
MERLGSTHGSLEISIDSKASFRSRSLGWQERRNGERRGRLRERESTRQGKTRQPKTRQDYKKREATSDQSKKQKEEKPAVDVLLRLGHHGSSPWLGACPILEIHLEEEGDLSRLKGEREREAEGDKGENSRSHYIYEPRCA